MNLEALYGKARQAAGNSYSPYSKFRVGAALLCTDGSVFVGANIENRSFGLTICAERSALVAAASAGKRAFSALAVHTPDTDSPVSPCGACRQVLSEFAPPEMPVVYGNGESIGVRTTLGELFPQDALHDLAESI